MISENESNFTLMDEKSLKKKRQVFINFLPNKRCFYFRARSDGEGQRQVSLPWNVPSNNTNQNSTVIFALYFPVRYFKRKMTILSTRFISHKCNNF